MPELTTVPTETSLADADEMYFNDVSETPDALNRITWANILATLGTWLGYTKASSAGPTQMEYYEDTDNGTNKVTLKAAPSLAANYTATLPSATGVLLTDTAIETDPNLASLENTLVPSSLAAKSYADAKISDTAYNATSWNGVTDIAASKNAVRDKIETLQPALTGTYSLANFTDPGSGVASAAMGGAMGTWIFGSVSYSPSTGSAETVTFAVENAIGAGTYSDTVVVGADMQAGDMAAFYAGFGFWVPTGRKWKHTDAGSPTMILNGIVL